MTHSEICSLHLSSEQLRCPAKGPVHLVRMTRLCWIFSVCEGKPESPRGNPHRPRQNIQTHTVPLCLALQSLNEHHQSVWHGQPLESPAMPHHCKQWHDTLSAADTQLWQRCILILLFYHPFISVSSSFPLHPVQQAIGNHCPQSITVPSFIQLLYFLSSLQTLLETWIICP